MIIDIMINIIIVYKIVSMPTHFLITSFLFNPYKPKQMIYESA